MVREFSCRTEDETADLGRQIAAQLPADSTVYLVGDLGAGKTFLARAIATALGADPLEINSPSFAIVHEYPVAARPAIIHIDAYRLSEHPREWLEIGIPELLDGPGVKLVEWPKKGFGALHTPDVEIHLEVIEDGSRRVQVRKLD